MAIYLIVTAILRLFKSNLFAVFLHFAVQLLNLAVLLSYPINFFIYCRMSRSFRDAFTRLLCPSLTGPRQDRLQSIATPLLSKQSVPANHNHQHSDVTNTQTDMRSSHPDNRITASSVILNSTINELPMSTLALTAPLNGNPTKKGSVGSLGKPRVSFSNDLNSTRFTDL